MARDFMRRKEKSLLAISSHQYPPAVKRFNEADIKGMEYDMENQRNWNDLVVAVQDIK